ncbi:MAG: hypothetical protein HY791_35735 [Deltaproteobacteria bacterium]|nr:hypothetical protein [Deltaproteobacteria bacterium]
MRFGAFRKLSTSDDRHSAGPRQARSNHGFSSTGSTRDGLWAGALVALAACGTADPVADPCAEPPTFAQDIRPGVVERTCISCHTETKQGIVRQGATTGLDYDRYELITDLPGFADSITSGRMPPPTLDPANPTSDVERAQVALWRKCGFKP